MAEIDTSAQKQEIEKAQEEDIWFDCYSIKISKHKTEKRDGHEKWTGMQTPRSAIETK